MNHDNLPHARARATHALPLLLLLTLATAAIAQPDDANDGDADAPATSVTQSITVTTTLPELAPTELLDADALAADAPVDLGGALRRIDGTAAVRRGPINLEPSVRGLQETQVALFVDGTRTFAAGPARMDAGLSHVHPDAVAQLQVVKGPYALTWGAGALSAVRVDTVDLATRSDAGFGGTLDGSFRENGDQLDGYADARLARERVWGVVSVGHRTGDDVEPGDPVGDELVPGDYRSTDSRLRLGLELSDAAILRIGGGYQAQDDIDYPGRLLDATLFRTRSYDASFSQAAPAQTFFAQAYANRKDHRMNNDEKPTARDMPGRMPPFGLRVDLPTESNTAGGRARLERLRGDRTWTFGVDGAQVEQNADRRIFRRADDRLLFDDAVWPDATLRNLGGYAQVVQRGARTSYGGAVRVDASETEADRVSDFFRSATGLGSDDASTDDVEISAAFSAAIELAPSRSLRLGVGRVARTPTTLERYSDRFPSTRFQSTAEFIGDPALTPETAWQVDLGLDQRAGDWLVQIDGFYRAIDDVITVVADPDLARRLPLSPPLVYRYRNGDRATYYGGELRVDWAPPQRGAVRVRAHAGLSYVRGEDETFDEPALGMPPLTGRLGLQLGLLDNRLGVDADLRVTDRQDRVATSRLEQETSGATVIDLRARYRVADGVELSVGALNLGDERYADHLNAPSPFTRARVLEPGRSLTVGVRVRR
ncbi:MAG: TonB-dependent receptor [Acidobacteriota bacterium]